LSDSCYLWQAQESGSDDNIANRIEDRGRYGVEEGNEEIGDSLGRFDRLVDEEESGVEVWKRKGHQGLRSLGK
jgi:hypothetical protein